MLGCTLFSHTGNFKCLHECYCIVAETLADAEVVADSVVVVDLEEVGTPDAWVAHVTLEEVVAEILEEVVAETLEEVSKVNNTVNRAPIFKLYILI